MGLFGDPKCAACGRRGKACICKSVQRRHRKENAKVTGRSGSSSSSGPVRVQVARQNSGHLWCSCGALIRNGRCVSAICGKAG